MKFAGQDHDIVVVGGGLAGLAFACALRDTEFRVLVLEAGALPALPGAEFDVRVNSIHLGSESFLQAIGAWEAAADIRVNPFNEIKVWDETGGCISFHRDEIGAERLGHIVENKVLTWALAQTLEGASNVELRANAQLESIQAKDDAVEVALTVGTMLRCGLVVGADGGNSSVRQLAGISSVTRDYGQRAIVAQLKTSEPHRSTSYQKFLPAGPLAFLPLSDGTSSIVWSCEHTFAQSLEQLKDAEFASTLARCFDYRLGDLKLVSRRLSFELRKLSARSYLAERVVLIGDAAHVIHPLAGMGANLGLMDAAALAELITHRLQPGPQLWNYSVFREFERWRSAANAPVMTAMDWFDAGFRSSSSMLKLAAAAGLNLTDGLLPAKRLIMRLACGSAGDLPALARHRVTRLSQPASAAKSSTTVSS